MSRYYENSNTESEREMLTFEEHVLGGNPLQWSGFGSNPEPEPNPEFGTVGNTNYKKLILLWQWQEPSCSSNLQSDSNSEEQLKL